MPKGVLRQSPRETSGKYSTIEIRRGEYRIRRGTGNPGRRSAAPVIGLPSEPHAKVSPEASWGHEMRSRACGQEVIHRDLVSDVEHG